MIIFPRQQTWKNGQQFYQTKYLYQIFENLIDCQRIATAIFEKKNGYDNGYDNLI